MSDYINMPRRDFDQAVRIANDAGKRGKEISLEYIPAQSAMQDGGLFVVNEYDLSASGTRI